MIEIPVQIMQFGPEGGFQQGFILLKAVDTGRIFVLDAGASNPVRETVNG